MPYEHDSGGSVSLEDASELASLLAASPDGSAQQFHQDDISVFSITSSISGIVVPRSSTNAKVTNILYFITFIASYASGFIELPITRLVEDLLCHDYYNTESPAQHIDESLCKEDVIQKKLAYILAIQATLGSIVAFIAAFPWGLAADKFVANPPNLIHIMPCLIRLKNR